MLLHATRPLPRLPDVRWRQRQQREGQRYDHGASAVRANPQDRDPGAGSAESRCPRLDPFTTSGHRASWFIESFRTRMYCPAEEVPVRMSIVIPNSSQAAELIGLADLVTGDPAQRIVGGGGLLTAAGRVMPTCQARLRTNAEATKVEPSRCGA